MKSVLNLGLYFCIYAHLGWVVEVIYHSILLKKFVNRGFLYGPVCPIYGFGVLFILTLLTPFTNNLILLFLGSMLITSAIELITGFILEVCFKTRWWDYSDRPFNLFGYICLQFSLYWAISATILVLFIHPFIIQFVNFFPPLLKIALLIIHLIYFAYDTFASINKANEFINNLKHLSEITNQLTQLSYILGEEIDKLVEHRYIKAYPEMKSNHYNSILEMIREERKKRGH